MFSFSGSPLATSSLAAAPPTAEEAALILVLGSVAIALAPTLDVSTALGGAVVAVAAATGGADVAATASTTGAPAPGPALARASAAAGAAPTIAAAASSAAAFFAAMVALFGRHGSGFRFRLRFALSRSARSSLSRTSR